jgi:hypothetical protein
MAFYDDMAATATELLAEFGAPIAITRETGGSRDPVTGVETPGTVETFTPSGVLKPYPARLIDGTLIQAGDRELIIDASMTPLMTDRPLVSGREWAIVRITTVNPAGTPIVHRLQLRG